MGRTIISSYFVELKAFNELSIYGRRIRRLLELVRWDNMLSIKDMVYPNLVKVLYSNMELSASRQGRIITNVGGSI